MAGLLVPKGLSVQVHGGTKWPWPGWGMAMGRGRWLWEGHPDCCCLTFVPAVVAPADSRRGGPHYSTRGRWACSIRVPEREPVRPTDVIPLLPGLCRCQTTKHPHSKSRFDRQTKFILRTLHSESENVMYSY